MKPDAKRLLAQFGSLGALFNAAPDELRAAGLKSDAAVTQIKVIQAAALKLSASRVADVPVLSSWDALMDHCQATMQ